MKNILLLLLLHTASTYGQQSHVAFEAGSWEQALAKARQFGKPVLLYAWSPACSPCRTMEKDVFSDPAVSAFYNRTFISYKVNIDAGAGKELARQYAITSLPAYLYFDQAGGLMHVSGSGKKAAAFIQDGRDALDPQKAYFNLERQYLAGIRTPALLYNYSTATALPFRAPELYDQVATAYLRTQSPAELNSPKNLQYLFSLATSFESEPTQYFLTHQSAFISLFGPVEVAGKTKAIVLNAASAAGHKNDSVKLIRIQQLIRQIMPQTAPQYVALARIRYLQAQPERHWHHYAAATADYGRLYATLDSNTLYETAVYINAFCEDKALLKQGEEIISQALAVRRTYDYLLIQAKLLHKMQQNATARTRVEEAVALAAKEKVDAQEAAALLQELTTAPQGK